MRHLKFPLAAVLGVVALGVLASGASAAVPADDEVVLPSRVANAIHRAEISLDNAIDAVDTGDKVKAVASLKAVRANMLRADKAARAQMNAVPVPDPEDAPDPEDLPDPGEVPDPEDLPDPEDVPEGTTFGPDSVVAVLNLDYEIITTFGGLFDTKAGIVVDGLSPALFATMNARDSLLDAVIALDPEGAGADYADVMADIVTNFDDEASNLSEATTADLLSAGGLNVLGKALAQSSTTQAKVALAFGGGE